MVLLEVRQVSKSFGNLQAVDNISMQVEEGELVGLVGPNGSGKTTLFNLITGFYRPNGGEIFFDGKRIDRLRPDKIASYGLMRMFQANVIFGEQSVLDNVLLGLFTDYRSNYLQAFFRTNNYVREENNLAKRANELLGKVGLSEFSNLIGRDLPHGHKRRVGLAIAQVSKPRLLLVDEPMSGLTIEERDVMINQLRAFHQEGLTIVLIEHHLKSVLSICKRIVVLNFGKKIADGEADQVMRQREVVEAYLGRQEV